MEKQHWIKTNGDPANEVLEAFLAQKKSWFAEVLDQKNWHYVTALEQHEHNAVAAQYNHRLVVRVCGYVITIP